MMPYLTGKAGHMWMMINGTEGEEAALEFSNEVTKLWLEVVNEYADKPFAYRKHGSITTYNDGCTGPICTMANRQQRRSTRGGGVSEYWERYEPVLEALARGAQEQVHNAREIAVVMWFRDTHVDETGTFPGEEEEFGDVGYLQSLRNKPPKSA